MYIDIHECRRFATRMREMRDSSLFTYTEIYLYRSLLRMPFSLPPPLPVERPSLLKFLASVYDIRLGALRAHWTYVLGNQGN